MFTIALSGWIVAFINSRQRKYRFVMLLPICMLMFQLVVYVLDARKNSINDFNTKVLVNGALIIALVIYYFLQTPKSK